MSRITVDELIYLLQRQDTEAQYIVVEGPRDTNFWSLLVPISERKRAAIIPVTSIECEQCEGGERGRAVNLAERLLNTPVADRIIFFLDADNDRILGKPLPDNVILTDYRDHESYALNRQGFRSILYAVGRDPEDSIDYENRLFDIATRLGLMRLADFELDFCLPFRGIFIDHPQRVLNPAGKSCQLDEASLLRRLLSGANLLGHLANFEEHLSDITDRYGGVEPRQLTNGKDAAAIFSRMLGVSYLEAIRLIHLAIASCMESIKLLPNLARVEALARA
ncbi:MAG: hypothetical protein ACTHM0_11240 [Sphingomonas sp.]